MVTKNLYRRSAVRAGPWTICFAFVQHPGIKSAKNPRHTLSALIIFICTKRTTLVRASGLQLTKSIVQKEVIE
jgi:hypothetical protein